MVVILMVTKICSACHKDLPLTSEYFEKRSNCKDGFRNQCKTCRNAKKKAKYIHSKNNRQWNDKEINILQKYYPHYSNKYIADNFLKDRSPEQIVDFATKKLNLHKDDNYKNGWTPEQVNFVRNNYSNIGITLESIANKINKSEASITHMANSMGIIRDNLWTDKEIIKINKYYSFMSNQQLHDEYLNDKTIEQILSYASNHDIHKNEIYLKNKRISIGLNNLNNIQDNHGENSPRWVKRFKVSCDYCHKDILLTVNDINNSKRHFCNFNCMGKWMSQNLKGNNNHNYNNGIAWTEKMRKECAKRAISRLKNSDFMFNYTKPEKITDKILDELNIKHTKEFDCKYYLVDRYLPDYNLMIEVQGNFYHCSPLLQNKNSREKSILRKDTAKHTFVKKYYHVNILYLWEYDLLNRYDLCKKIIELYIRNNGNLDNYHSFNYQINNGELTLLKDQLVIGY